MSELNYKQWFWTECDELNKDTSFAYSLAEKAWNHQQAKIDEIAKHVACIKTIVSECDENTNSSWILGNIDGFVECMEKILNDQSN